MPLLYSRPMLDSPDVISDLVAQDFRQIIGRASVNIGTAPKGTFIIVTYLSGGADPQNGRWLELPLYV